MLDAVTSSFELELTLEDWVYFPDTVDKFHKQINARHGSNLHTAHFPAKNNKKKLFYILKYDIMAAILYSHCSDIATLPTDILLYCQI